MNNSYYNQSCGIITEIINLHTSCVCFAHIAYEHPCHRKRCTLLAHSIIRNIIRLIVVFRPYNEVLQQQFIASIVQWLEHIPHMDITQVQFSLLATSAPML